MVKFDPKKRGLLTQKRIFIQEKRIREIQLLKKAGWKRKRSQEDGWVNPRSGRIYSEYVAIAIEDLNRTLNRRKYI